VTHNAESVVTCAWGNCHRAAIGQRWWDQDKTHLPVCDWHVNSADLYRCAGCGWKIRAEHPERWGPCRYCGCDAWRALTDDGAHIDGRDDA